MRSTIRGRRAPRTPRFTSAIPRVRCVTGPGPWWNVESISFLSTTALGEQATLKTKFHLNSFDNGLDSYDNRTQTTQTLGRSFNSAYDDRGYGGSVRMDVNLLPVDRLSVAFQYRNDRHREYQEGFAPAHVIEPWQTAEEETYSAALENSLMLSPTVDLLTGLSYDWRNLSDEHYRLAEGFPEEGWSLFASIRARY